MKKFFSKKKLFVFFVCLFVISSIFNFSKQVIDLNKSTQTFNALAVEGVDISGLSQVEACEKVKSVFNEIKEQLEITLKFEDKSFVIVGKDIQPANFEYLVYKALEDNQPKTFLEKINIFRKRGKIIIPKDKLIFSLDDKINTISKQVERKAAEPQIKFYPNNKQMFEISDEQIGVCVNMEKLKNDLAFNLQQKNKFELDIPVFLTPVSKTKKDVLKNLKLRSEYSTNYSNSVGGRKHNIIVAMKAFNGLVIEPNEIISFNNLINKKVPDSDIRTAKIIVNGEFVEGKGGGLCQASTTVYNAALLSDLEILEVHPHTLPVGYVSMAFDAMVNFGSADMVFRNNTENPLFVKAWGDEKECHIQIYGEPLPKGLSLKQKSRFVKSIPHEGDKIILDTKGIYSDKILFKGEYHRVKYPQEGYEAEGYIQYYIDGELVEERLVRRARYNAQQGIIYEGTEKLFDGLSLPDNDLKPIQAQKESLTNQDTVDSKIKQVSPPHFSP